VNYTNEPNKYLNKIRLMIDKLETIEDLNFVKEMVIKCKKIKAVEIRNDLIVGSSVKIIGAESRGIFRGTIVKINRSKAVVDVDGHVRHFTIPFEMLSKQG